FLGLSDQAWFWSLGFYFLIALIAGCGLLVARDDGRRQGVPSPTFAPSPTRLPATQAVRETPRGKEQAPRAPPLDHLSHSDDVAPSWRDCAFWLLLAAVPAGLLVAVTAHISTDIAAVPLLWVIPLAVYLLSLIIVFTRRPLIPHRLVIAAQPLFVIALVAVIVFEPTKKIIWLVTAHVVVFFVCALMCHGELARTRPRATHLTAFYLWIPA